MISYPLVLKGALSVPLFYALTREFNNEGWVFKNSDYSESGYTSWTIEDKTRLLFYEVGVTLSLKLRKTLKKPLTIVKIHVNGQTEGQLSSFHTDADVGYAWTVVLFTNGRWNVNNGGEFTLYDPVEKEYKSVSYIPNTAVLFPAAWDHRGAPPLSTSAGLRTSLAITYCDSNFIDEFVRLHPESSSFSGLYPLANQIGPDTESW